MGVAVAFDYNKIDNNKVVEFKKPQKLNKDGSVSKVKCNKVAGVSSEVYAFKTEEEIKAIYKVLNNHIAEANNLNQLQIAERNKLLFSIGMNIGIRASDLRNIKWSFFYEEDTEGKRTFRESYKIMPKKTATKKKYVTLYFNETVKKAVEEYVKGYPVEDLDTYVFLSRKGDEPLLERCITKIIKDTAEEAGIKQNIGSHTLRKTFGFWRWHEANDKDKALVILSALFNHASVATTRKYIGILDEEIEDMFDSVELGYNFI